MKRPKGRFVSDQVLSKHRSNIIFCLHILNFLSCSFLSDKMDIFNAISFDTAFGRKKTELIWFVWRIPIILPDFCWVQTQNYR